MYGHLFALITYAVVSLVTLVVLSGMILRIGRMLGDCPQSQARAQAAAITIATGYSAVGLGGVILGAAAVALAPASIFMAAGVVVICLGLAFGHAIATLRAVSAPPPNVPAMPAVEAAAS